MSVILNKESGYKMELVIGIPIAFIVLKKLNDGIYTEELIKKNNQGFDFDVKAFSTGGYYGQDWKVLNADHGQTPFDLHQAGYTFGTRTWLTPNDIGRSARAQKEFDRLAFWPENAMAAVSDVFPAVLSRKLESSDMPVLGIPPPTIPELI